MIITMLPYLANLIHSADASLHDNTYKRVFGHWKEWEVVIWDKRLNTSMSNVVLDVRSHVLINMGRSYHSAHLLHS
jgi:hypothetical protein